MSPVFEIVDSLLSKRINDDVIDAVFDYHWYEEFAEHLQIAKVAFVVCCDTRVVECCSEF